MGKYGGYSDLPALAELYDQIPAYSARKDVGFYVSSARSANGTTLEMGCGTGRVLVPVAEAGCRIVGLDLSEPMLKKCRGRLKRAPQEVQSRARTVQGDMTNFDLEENFALVTTPFRSFQHLVAVEDQIACLRCVNRHLEAGRILILDIFHPNLQYLCDPESYKEKEDRSTVPLPHGRTLRQAQRIVALHRVQQVMDVRTHL